jgi:hypothetical protein
MEFLPYRRDHIPYTPQIRGKVVLIQINNPARCHGDDVDGVGNDIEHQGMCEWRADHGQSRRSDKNLLGQGVVGVERLRGRHEHVRVEREFLQDHIIPDLVGGWERHATREV